MSLVADEPATSAKPRRRTADGAAGVRKTPLPRRIRRDRALIAMMVPGVLYFLVFQYGAIFMNVIGFEHYMPFVGIVHSDAVGLANFSTLFGDPAFWHALWTTISLALLQLVFYIPIPLAVALLLHSLLRGVIRQFVQSIVLLPHFVSWVIAVALVQEMIGPTGLLQGLMSGGGNHIVNLFTDPHMFKPIMVGELIWKDCGWATVIFTAALFQVDEQLYEAAAMDGAGPWRRFLSVTLPGVRPVVVVVVIMRLGQVLSTGFDQVMIQGMSFGQSTSEVLDTYVYNHATINGEWSVAATAGIFKGLVALALVIAANKIAHRLGEQGVYQ